MAYTSALLHCNGVNNGTTFTDETGKTWNRGGNTVTSTSSPKFGTASAYFPGSSDSLTSSTSSEFNFGTGTFTIDFWMKTTKITGYGGILQTNNNYTSSNAWLLFQNATNLQFYYGSSSAFNVDDAYWGDGAWHHIAVTRNTTTLKMYVDGTERGTATSAGIGTYNFGTNTLALLMGYQYGHAGTRDFLGYIDELRISKGIVRWSSNFTPPSDEYIYSPASGSPSLSPSISPSLSPSSSVSPSRSPSISPSRSPSISPSLSPSSSVSPSISPSVSPSLSPSSSMSPSSSVSPSLGSSSVSPSQSPSLSPSVSPSRSPSVSPSISPSVSPSLSPSASPSVSPSAPPTSASSSISPSLSPSVSPSVSPSASLSPSASPSISPSASLSPSASPSTSPSVSPSVAASYFNMPNFIIVGNILIPTTKKVEIIS